MSDANGAAFIAALAGLTVAILVIGLFRGNATPTPRAIVQRRVEQLGTPEEADPLARSFAERVMQPILGAILRVATRVLPTSIVGSVSETLEVAGRPMTTSRFLIMWAIAGICLPLTVALAMIVVSGGIGTAHLIVVGLLIGGGLYLPWTSIRRKAKQRAKRISRDLPDAIDLIITNVEAGLGMQASLLVVSEKFGGPIGEAFGRVVREISVGADRTGALVSMAERTGVPEMRLFARAVAQAEQTGIPVARVLRNHSAEVREKRRQRAREQAAKIPVKITIPTVLVMFPTLFLLILGPVALNVMDQFGSP